MRAQRRGGVCLFEVPGSPSARDKKPSAVVRRLLRPLERVLGRVVSRAITRLVGPAGWRVGEVDLNAAEFRLGVVLRWIVGQQILHAQFVADLAEGFV